MNRHKLPLTRELTAASQLAMLVTILTSLASLAGLLFPSVVYSGKELRQSFLVNDIVNLTIGLPVLLGALWLLRRGNLFGLLGLPGALFYVTYNSIAYAAAMPLTWPFFAYLGLAGLSALAIFRLLSSVEAAAVQARLRNHVAERFGAGVLIGLGALFFLYAVAEFFDRAANWAAFGVIVADGLTTPLWVVGGLYLWRKRPIGYLSGLGLLLQASMLFVGLIAFFILQPFVAGVPFRLADFLVILVMGLIVFISFGLFVRGMQAGQPINP